MFVHISIVSHYDLKYKLKGELNWYFDLIKKCKKYKVVDFTIVHYTLGGIGDTQYKLNLKETLKVLFKRAEVV